MATKDNKYEKILSISTKLFSAKGFEGTTLQEIADKAGLHKSTLFHYLKDKEELLLRIVEKSFGNDHFNLEFMNILVSWIGSYKIKWKMGTRNGRGSLGIY